MSRLVIITGFANPQSSAERVGEALAIHYGYDDFNAFTLGNALAEPEVIAATVKGQDVFTHSAGMLALKDSMPAQLHAFNAPLPTTRRAQVAQTLLRNWKERDVKGVNGQLRVDSGFWDEAKTDPKRHLGPFLDGRISNFHAIRMAIAAQKAGIQVGMAYTERDAYFHPGPIDIAKAQLDGVKIAQFAGVHDELILRPQQTANTYFANRR